jgi:hypothetical protein
MSNSTTSPGVHHGPSREIVGWSLAGVLMGVITGYALGATVGGIWVAEFSVGRLDGAEATGVFGALVGGIAVGVLAFWLAVRQRAVAIVWGFLGVAVGLILGTIVGAIVAGNWTTDLTIGSEHGAEAGGVVGGVLGAMVVGTLSTWLGLRHRSTKPIAR